MRAHAPAAPRTSVVTAAPRRLRIGPRHDAFEREADRAADAVLRGRPPSLAAAAPAAVQRACAACQEELVQRQANAAPGGGAIVQRQADGSGAASEAVSARIQARRGAGVPLPAGVRARFETAFGRDFGRVRLHTDGEAAGLARGLNAAAFTTGHDIYFGAGRFAPGTPPGWRLLAHELAHTVQQGASPTIRRLDDATFERQSGVGSALRARPPTMVRAPAVHGTTFTASSCAGADGGRARCNVAFRFAKAFVGDYNNRRYPGQPVRGVYVKIVMTPTAGCGTCDAIDPMQAIRYTTSSERRFTTAPPDTEWRKERAGWNDPAAPSRGWWIDRLQGATTPVPRTANPGSGGSPAILWDAPGHFVGENNQGKDFQTCALCRRRGQPRVSLACVNWGYYTDASGRIAFRPARPAAACGTAQVFRDAAARWDAIPGNTAINLAP